ncbi:Disease resistance RPP8-like protein 3 [Forsythia ovata]|uniref:Disease resistance RPP8-like protein 3 n=1 Tax=Forsythia ovata TaxID=205694 RepID=A0ABD1TB15_9LAMI
MSDNIFVQVELAGTALEFLQEKLNHLRQSDDNLILELKSLYNNLYLLKDFLEDSMKMRRKNKVLKEVARQIRDVVNEAEDTVDMLVSQAAVRKSRGLSGKVFHKFDYSAKRSLKLQIKSRGLFGKVFHVFDYSAKRSLKLQIKSISKKVKYISEDTKDFGFDALLKLDEEESAKITKVSKAPIVEDDYVVGFEDEAEKVIELLTRESDELEVVSIVGMPGLGKTTLANLIYHHPHMEYEFYNRAWVYISQEYSRKEVFLNICGHFAKPRDEMYKMTDENIAKELRAYLEIGKYLIVVDDVWTEDAWDDLKIAFPKNNKNGRILLTSRNKRVAKHANPNVEPHNLRFLTLDESWILLLRKALGTVECPNELRQYGMLIANKCGGLPLALAVIGGILLEKGFIQQKRGTSLEDIAEEYLGDLVDRNLVMVGDRRVDGKVKRCFLHSFVYAFCKNQAEHENFFQEIKPFDQDTYSSSNYALENYGRISIHSGVSNYISSKPHGPRVRSFLCFSSEKIILQAEDISAIPRAFKLLRVLDARPISFTRFPTDLVQLVHLRYLVLSSDFKILPAAISSLWNMQTLIVETSSRTLEIKGDIWKMIQLRHLKTNASTSLPGPLAKSRKKRDDSLINANLRTVSTISPESCADVLARASYLKKLGIRGPLAELLDTNGASSLFDSLKKLDSLKLLNDAFPLPPSEGKLPGLPQRDKFPPNLKKLTLADTRLDWVHMSTLGLLPKLEILKLKDNAYEGESWKAEDGGFRALKVLHIGRTKLVQWEASAHHFPRLESLRLKHCSNLLAVPLGLADVSSLQIIDLYRTSKSAADSARKIQQHKIFMQGKSYKQTTKSSEFRLSIYPPDQDQ